jgi:hypothetical protein
MKEKKEVEHIAEKFHTAIQKLYKKVSEVPMVVEARVEEQVWKISEAIQGLCKKIT